MKLLDQLGSPVGPGRRHDRNQDASRLEECAGVRNMPHVVEQRERWIHHDQIGPEHVRVFVFFFDVEEVLIVSVDLRKAGAGCRVWISCWQVLQQ